MKRIGFIAICAACVALFALPTHSSAAIIPVPVDVPAAGSRSSDYSNQIVGGGQWATGWGISWSISGDNVNGWDFTYTLTSEERSLSHLILQVSASVTSENVNSLVTDWRGFTSLTVADFSPSGPGQSNPGLPGTLHGMKLEGGLLSFPVALSFHSHKMPVWGDLYAKDGNNPETYAYNAGFGQQPVPGDPDPYFRGWIPVLDTLSPSDIIPEPASAVIWGVLGAAGAAGLALRRRNRVPARTPWSEENRKAIFEIVGQERR